MLIMSHQRNLETLGYTVIQGFLGKRDTVSCLAEVARVAEIVGNTAYAPPTGEQSIIRNDKIINNIHFHSEYFLHLISHGQHIPILASYLNDEWYGLIPKEKPNFILAQCNCRKSSTALPYHVDVRMKVPGHRSWSMQCIIALEDRTKENGGLSVIKGSHKNERLRPDRNDYENEVFIDLQAGDMVIFHSQLIHGTTNVQEGFKPGWGLLLTFRSWWCKPQFCFMSMFTKERIEGYDDVTKTLLGYYSHPSSDVFGSPSSRTGYKNTAEES